MPIQIVATLEDRIAYLAESQGEKVKLAVKKDTNAKLKDPTQVITHIAKADPSNGKYLQWLVRMYVAGQFKQEDVGQLHKDITIFEKFKNKIANKDLNSYKDRAQFNAAIEPFEQQAPELSKAEQEKMKKKEGAEYIINTPHFKALVPKTEEAACLYGKGTKWCTAAENNNQFENYHSQGDLVIVMTELDGKPRKFQLHPDTQQYMNEKDEPITKAEIAKLSKIPEYTELLNILIDKHYGKYFNE
jgi:hypothetical protein